MRLLKIGPRKTKGLFEEYFYSSLVVIFGAVAILGKAAGLTAYNALVVGAWVAAFIWFAAQLKGYYTEKAKAGNGKILEPPPEQAEILKAPLQPAPGMKPMIGPQWPVKTGPWPARPGQAPLQTTQAKQAKAPATPAVPSKPQKQGFVYERPTLPDRKPKLPNNWLREENKKPKP